MATENNTQNHVQLNFNFKLHDIFLSSLVTDMNIPASKRKKYFPVMRYRFFFRCTKFHLSFFDDIISAPFIIFVWILMYLIIY